MDREIADTSREPDWLPGCYLNLAIESGEALPSYLLRLAEANGYAGIGPLLRATGLWTNAGGYSFRLRLRGDLLAAVGRMAVGDANHLRSHVAREMEARTYQSHGTLIDCDVPLSDSAQVCPQCLGEEGFVRQEFELAPVTVCPTHQAMLLDICQSCATALTWERPSLLHCGHCGADLRLQSTEQADPLVCEVASDFAALAPFRMVAHSGQPLTETWDMMFLVFKALALPGSVVAAGRPPQNVVRSLPVQERHAIAEQLARVRRHGSYFLMELQWRALADLAPLTAIPRPHVVEHCALEFLTTAWLPRELAEAMCSPEHPLPPEPSGAARFHGRPPALYSDRQVLGFLAIDLATLDGLLARGILHRPIEEHGYDIDELLAAQDFLSKGLLTLAELSSYVGVPLDWEDLGRSPLIKTWNPKNAADRRVAVDDLLLIQKRLTEYCDASFEDGGAVTIGEIARGAEHSFQVVSEVVIRACHGELGRIGWRHPFDWACIVLPRKEAEKRGSGEKAQDATSGK